MKTQIIGSLAALEVGPVADAPEGRAATALPCLHSGNCIEKVKEWKRSLARLTPHQKRVRHKIIMAVEWMGRKHGIERVGLLTLSFGVPGSGKGSVETWELRQQAKEVEFVQNRWHSFCTNVVAARYEDWVCVFELHRDRVWHIHVVVATKEDIRTGTDVATLTNYKLPYWMRRGKHLRNEALAAEWKELRQVACRYRFGRVELLPVKKSAEAMGKYLGDYLAKTYGLVKSSKRHRLVRFSGQINKAISTKFTIHGIGPLIYRTRLRIAARMLGFKDYGDFAIYFGPRWNFLLKNAITWIPIPFRFGRKALECGFAAAVLADYAERPKSYLQGFEQEKIRHVALELGRRFQEALEKNAPARVKLQWLRWGDNHGDSSATSEDLQGDLFQPF